MLNIVLFGPPGSGKGTQSEKIINMYGLTHFSTGDMLRAELAAETDLGLKASSIMEKGELVSDEIIIGMIRNKISGETDAKGFIFDGFPRTVAQAEALDDLLEELGMKIHVMLGLEVERQELIDRLLKRGQDQGRADDNLETIENRIKVYEDQTSPVMGYYDAQGKYRGVNGLGSIDDIFQRLREIIKAL
ncbi:adenylate kinase [Bacteroidota bacterium]